MSSSTVPISMASAGENVNSDTAAPYRLNAQHEMVAGLRHNRRIGEVIDHIAVGLKDLVFIEVTLDKHDDKVLGRFGDALARIPEVIEAHLVTGDYDYLVKVAVADTTHYERFLREKPYRIQGIRHTRSTFSLRTLKLVMSADPLLVSATD